MSRLYISADTDMIKNTKTARANRYIDENIFFNPEDYNDYVKIKCVPQGEKGMICTVLHEGEPKGEIVVDENGNVKVVGKYNIAKQY